MKKLVFVGTGRCGTKYVSALCRSMGLDVGHEEVFHTQVLLPEFKPVWGDHVGDSSWLALAWNWLTPEDHYVVHIRREQSKVEESYLALRTFADANDALAVRRVMEIIVPGLNAAADELSRLRKWITSACSCATVRANETVAVEALTMVDVERWAAVVGVKVHEPTAYPPTNTNGR